MSRRHGHRRGGGAQWGCGTGRGRADRSSMQNQSERPGRPITILMADDDEDDRELAREVLSGARCVRRMDFVADGQELVDYLRGEGSFAGRAPEGRPAPSLILLD